MGTQGAATPTDPSEVQRLERNARRLRRTLVVVVVVAVAAVLLPWIGCFVWMSLELNDDLFNNMPNYTFVDEHGKERAFLQWSKDGGMEIHLLDGNAVWKVVFDEIAPGFDKSTTTTSTASQPATAPAANAGR